MSDRLIIQSVTKFFGAATNPVRAVDDLSLTVRENEFFTLLGPSGCGKTTLLRLIAGLETCDEGKILLDGQDIAALPPNMRPVNTVFQSYALFPHMTVNDNIGFGLRMLGKEKNERDKAAAEALELMRMQDFGARYPSELSGGQQQRVALARALVNRPKILLLDESLSALDYKLRKDMQIELKRLQRETEITFIFVTHDQEEALSMSDRIAVMERGRIGQLGTPQEIYHRPVSRYVADFIGICNFVAGTSLGLAEKDLIGFRPEDATLLIREGQVPDTPGPIVHGRLDALSYHGAVTYYQVTLDSGETVTVADHEKLPVNVDDRVRVALLPDMLIRCAS
jgi:spermidine/putrescine transport system ATP-binding protein